MQEITFQPAEKDLIDAHRLNYMVTLKTGRFLRVLLIGAVVIAAILAVGSWYFEVSSILFIASVGVAYWIVALLAMALASYHSIPRNSRRTFKQQKSLHDATRVEWDDSGIAIHSARGHSNFAWDDFITIVADDKMLILKQSDALMNFIPLRALSPDQASDIIRRAPAKA